MTKPEILAVYLTAVALLQAGLYFSSFGPHGMGAALYLDPRIGIDAWLTGGAMDPEARSRLTEVSQQIRWASAAWILCLGVLLTFRKPVIQVYVLSECVLSLPNLLFFGMVILANMNPGHGFSIGELSIPLVVFSVFTVVPLSMAIQEWRSCNGH